MRATAPVQYPTALVRYARLIRSGLKQCTSDLFLCIYSGIFYLPFLIEPNKQRMGIVHTHHHEIKALIRFVGRKLVQSPIEVNEDKDAFHKCYIAYIPLYKSKLTKKTEPPGVQFELVVHESHVHPKRKTYIRFLAINKQQILFYQFSDSFYVCYELARLVLPSVQD